MAVDRAYYIEVINDEAGFRALKAEWNSLLNSSPANCLFLTWEWVYTWWKHLAEDRKLNIITVRRDKELIAIAPLCLRPCRMRLFQFFRTLEFLGVGYVGSDYLDLIVRPDNEEAALQLIADHLAGSRSILELSQVNSFSRHISGLVKMLESYGWDISRKSTHVCPYINLSDHNWDTYLESLGGSHRYNFRRRLKNLKKKFDVRFEQISTEEQRKQVLPELIDLHNRRWHERGGSDAFHTPGLLNFHDDFSRTAFHQDWLRLYVLRLNGKSAATLYGFKYNNIFYFYQSGFDTVFSRDSVGLVIMGLAIKSAIEDGVDAYDFLHGDEGYKYLWTREQYELLRFTFAPPYVNGRLYRRNMQTREVIKKLVRKYFPQPVIEWLHQ